MLDNVELPTDGLGSLVEAVAPARAADETTPLAGLLAFARDSERAVQIAAFAQAFWRTRLGPSRPASACRPPPTTASCFAGGAWQRAGSMRSASTPCARPKRP